MDWLSDEEVHFLQAHGTETERRLAVEVETSRWLGREWVDAMNISSGLSIEAIGERAVALRQHVENTRK